MKIGSLPPSLCEPYSRAVTAHAVTAGARRGLARDGPDAHRLGEFRLPANGIRIGACAPLVDREAGGSRL